MTYIVFARKWRPQTFDEIIGQSHIAKVLKNAIKNERVAHAYIFAGPRGIGKTSAARIFAKAMNCEKGPAPTPCNKCTPCKEISESRSLDVLEIDGASNRGIDEIRNLRENVKFAPTQGRSKIYIIDEVHMLTQEAFNALLKTLEEPPPHVKFIFATTQPNKVPATILSRCQRFDFRKIPSKDIIGKLASISEQEDLQISEDALFAIARSADGSMRDAESVLDQLSSFTNKKIELSNVNQVLGTLSEDTLFEITDAIVSKDTPKALKMVDNMVKEGKDVSFVGLELLEHFRNLLIAKVGKDLKELIDLSEESIKRLSAQSGKFSVEDLLYALNVLSRAQEMMRRSNLTRVPLEMAVIKLTKKESIHSLGEILDKITALEGKMGEATAEDDVQDEPVTEQRRRPSPEPKSEPIPKSYQETKSDAVSKLQPEPESEEIPPPEPYADTEPKGQIGIKGEVTLQQIEHLWPNIIRSVGSKKISIASCLQEGEPVSYKGNTVILGFLKGHSFHREVIEKSQNKRIVEGVLSEVTGRELGLGFTTIEERRKSGGVGLEEPDDEDESLPEDLEPGPEQHSDPIVGSALDIFKGRIINNKRRKA